MASWVASPVRPVEMKFAIALIGVGVHGKSGLSGCVDTNDIKNRPNIQSVLKNRLAALMEIEVSVRFNCGPATSLRIDFRVFLQFHLQSF